MQLQQIYGKHNKFDEEANADCRLNREMNRKWRENRERGRGRNKEKNREIQNPSIDRMALFCCASMNALYV